MKKTTYLTLDEAIELINRHYNRPESKSLFKKKTFYNLISNDELTKKKVGRTVLVDKDEILARFCS